MAKENIRKAYSKKNIGSFPHHIEILGKTYEKIFDLRYGTNPHQKSCYYRPVSREFHFPMGNLELLKSGKNGLSQTNLEDIHYAIRLLKYLENPAVVIMKHANPSGVAMAKRKDDQNLTSIFQRALKADSRAAFGGVIVINRKVDSNLATEIMQSVFEMVVAIDYTPEAMEIFKDYSLFKRNKEIRVVKIKFLETISKYLNDEHHFFDIKTFEDGSLVVSDFFLSKIKSYQDLKPALCIDCPINSNVELDKMILKEMLFAWYVSISVRSNSVVITKNYETIAIGTGEQDRVGAIEKALFKADKKYEGKELFQGSVMASDGFIPFTDSIELAHKWGISAIIQPGGSIKDCEIIKLANKYNIGMVFTGERIFSHH